MATNGPDILTGTAGADVIEGLGGDDVIRGFGGGAGRRDDPGRARSPAAWPERSSPAPRRDAPDELFVVRKDVGSILILDPATSARSEFLAVPSSELTTGGEQGLLGLAFHPGYAVNGRFFVHLVNANGDIEVREYARSAADPDRADPEPVRTLLTVPHPVHANHNGGSLAFGPATATSTSRRATAAAGNDPAGQRAEHRRRCSARSCASTSTATTPGDPARNYAIPPDNPFVGARRRRRDLGLRPAQPLAHQLRPRDGDLYIADVGQKRTRR